jgi:hypothetical protein
VRRNALAPSTLILPEVILPVISTCGYSSKFKETIFAQV